jgi:hypothetical protein
VGWPEYDELCMGGGGLKCMSVVREQGGKREREREREGGGT